MYGECWIDVPHVFPGTRWRLYLASALTLCAMLIIGGVLTTVSLEGGGSDDYTLEFLVVRHQ